MFATNTAGRCAIDLARRGILGRGREIGAVIALICAVSVIAGDPHRAGRVFPRCPTKLVTGLDCPACGGLRMSHDLLHADMRAAVHDNVFLLVCSPVLATLAWRQFVAPVSAGIEPVPPRVAYALTAAATTWMVVRNLPCWPLKPIVRE